MVQKGLGLESISAAQYIFSNKSRNISKLVSDVFELGFIETSKS